MRPEAGLDPRERPPLYAALARDGAIAQLGERLNGIQEVSGSIPLGSTTTKQPGCSGPANRGPPGAELVENRPVNLMSVWRATCLGQ